MLFVLVMTVGSLVNVSYHQVPLTPPVCKEMLFDQLKEGPYLASCLLFKMLKVTRTLPWQRVSTLPLRKKQAAQNWSRCTEWKIVLEKMSWGIFTISIPYLSVVKVRRKTPAETTCQTSCRWKDITMDIRTTHRWQVTGLTWLRTRFYCRIKKKKNEFRKNGKFIGQVVQLFKDESIPYTR